MKTFSIVLLALFGFAAADVSHLSNHYLPPKDASIQDRNDQHMHTTTTTIEKQELQELPEQIEYVSPNQPTLQSYSNNNEMDQQQQPMMMMLQISEAKYLPPQPAQAPKQLQLKDLMPAMLKAEYLAPSQKESLPEVMPQMQLRMPAVEYFAPPNVPVQMEEQQPNYQQYQEVLMQQQHQGQEQNHMEMLEAMHIALNAVEQPQMTQAIMEPQPAHILAADGYHYKNGGNQMRFRFRQ